MILWAGHQSGKGKYLVYSNMDIGVQPPFYIKMARQMQVPRTPSPRRRCWRRGSERGVVGL